MDPDHMVRPEYSGLLGLLEDRYEDLLVGWFEDAVGVSQLEERRSRSRRQRRASQRGPRLRSSPRVSLGGSDYLGARFRLTGTRFNWLAPLSLDIKHRFDSESRSLGLNFYNGQHSMRVGDESAHRSLGELWTLEVRLTF